MSVWYFSTSSRNLNMTRARRCGADRAPVASGGLRRHHRALDVGTGGQHHLACDAPLGRIEDIAATGSVAGIGLAVDPVADEVGGVDEVVAHGDFSVWRERAALQRAGRD
jgi:hypothetical protein